MPRSILSLASLNDGLGISRGLSTARTASTARMQMPVFVWTSALAALGFFCFLRLVASGDVDGGQEEWPLRDLLAQDEALRDDWSREDRETLVRRALEHGQRDVGFEHLKDSPFELRDIGPWPTDPLGTIARLDLGRLDRGEDARLFAVYGHDGEEAWSSPCAPTELTRSNGARFQPSPNPWPNGWRASAQWLEGHQEEEAALRALTPKLAAWARRCGLGEPPAKQQLQVLQREEQAPFLLAYWPQRRKLYVHPLVLELWVDLGQEQRLEVRRQTLDTQNIGACIQSIHDFCEACDTEEEARENTDCSQLFPNSSVFQDCQTLRDDIQGGWELYCIHRIYVRLESCIMADAGSTCAKQNLPVSSVSTLVQAFAPYVDLGTSELCRQTARACEDGTNNHNNNEPEPEPEPDEEKQEPGLQDECCSGWCEPEDEEDRRDPICEYKDGCCEWNGW